MATSTTTYVNGMYKTTDENGRVTYSDSPPNTPITPQGGQQAEDADTGFVSNKTKGVIRTMEIAIDKRTGKSISIPRTTDGKIAPEFDQSAAAKKATEEAMKKLREEGDARAKVAAELADEAANESKLIGGNIGLEITLPDGTKLIDKKVSVGHEKTDTSISAGKDLGGTVKKVTKTEDIPTPGISLTGTVIISAKGQQTLGMSPKQMEIAQAADKNKEAYDADMAEAKNRFRQNAAPDLKAGKFPQAANDQYAKDTADIWRKWGKKAGDAAIQ